MIYADLEYLIEKTDGCKSNPEKIFTTKVDEHIPSCFSMSAILSFKCIENKHSLYCGKGFMAWFCKSLREDTTAVINFKKEKLKLSTNEHQISYESAKICYICEEKFKISILKIKKIMDHCHYTGKLQWISLS